MSLADLFANNYFVRLLRGQTGNYDLIVSMIGGSTFKSFSACT